jgi:signal transduction histidine kinase
MLQNTENSSLTAYYLIGSTFLLLLVVAIVTYAFLHQKKVVQLSKRLHEEEIRNQQAVFNALQEGEEKERKRLAEELHDGIGAKLSGLKMNVEYLKSTARENTELIEQVFFGLSEALEEVREISHNLLPCFFNDRGIEELLQDYMARFSKNNDCKYDLFVSPSVADLDQHMKQQTYRIITELLTNIHNHAKATFASVQINMEDGKMEIAVEDNGIGFNTDHREIKGIGLINIQNRVTFCKGMMHTDSSEKGTSVTIEIPLNTAA